MNPFEPPADLGPSSPSTTDAARPQLVRIWARRIGWLDVACAPGFICLVTWYTLYDDSSMAGVLWVYSFPAAVVGYAIPGIILMLFPRAGWVFQLLPLGLSFYAAQVLLAILRIQSR